MKIHAVLAALLLLAGCATAPAPAPLPVYDHSLYQAAVYRPEHLRRLKPAVADANGEVLVATLKGPRPWTLGQLDLTGDVWVTLDPEVRDRCRTFTGDVAMRLRQLLGLQPEQEVTQFVTMRVPYAALFRPSPVKRVDTEYPCMDVQARTRCNEFPDDADLAHRAWIAKTYLTLQIPNGYPWTHLGYTYDWAPGADRYGASEYVVPKGTRVVVVSAMPIAEYCGR